MVVNVLDAVVDSYAAPSVPGGVVVESSDMTSLKYGESSVGVEGSACVGAGSCSDPMP